MVFLVHALGDEGASLTFRDEARELRAGRQQVSFAVNSGKEARDLAPVLTADARLVAVAVVPQVALIALWFSLGGHFVELTYRNGLGRRLPARAGAQVPARLAFWFLGGAALYAGAAATHALLIGQGSLPFPWWVGGCGFVAAELFVHLLMRWRSVPSFYDGRG